jgi:hypothetical protein
MGTDFSFTPTAGMVIGVMAPLTMLTGIVNSLSTYWVWQTLIFTWVKLGVYGSLTWLQMEKMTRTYVIFHVVILVSCRIPASLSLASE